MVHHWGRIALRSLTLGGLLLTVGCHSFNHDWKRTTAAKARAEDLQGPWQGVWVSDVTGHTDRLRCLVSAAENGAYSARFKANYKKVFSFGYTVPLTVEQSGTNYVFRGQADLGWLGGGIYYYEGRADAVDFSSTYSNRYDHGTFRMGRPTGS